MTPLLSPQVSRTLPDESRAPSRAIPKIFQTLAADYWAPSLANVGLFPLRFRSPELEKDYTNRLNASMRHSFRPIACLTSVCNLGSFALVMCFSRASGQARLIHHTYRWATPCLLTLLLISISFFWAASSHSEGNFFERCAVAAFLFATILSCIWILGNIELTNDFGDRDTKLMIMHYKYIVAGASFTHLVIYLMCLCVVLHVRFKHAGPVSLLVYVILWILIMIALIIHRSEDARAIWLLVGLYGMLILSNITAAYCNELADRVSHIVMRQASDTILRARRTRRYITKSGLPISPLETLVRDLRRVHTIIEQVKAETGPQHETLTTVAINLTEILRILTKGTTLHARICTDSQGDDAARKFHYLYDTDRAQTSADVSRRRESSMFRVASEEGVFEASPRTLARADELECLMDEKLAERIGVDLTLTFSDLDAFKEHAIFEVGYVLMRPLLGILGCTSLCLRKWLRLLDFSSRSNQPYHNPLLSAFSAHSCIATLKAIGIYRELTDVEVVAVTVASLGRFLTQTGRSDPFYIRTNALVAILYSDKDAVQSMSFQTLLRTISVSTESNILAEVSETTWRDIRHLIADLILDLSHSRHFATLSRIRVIRHAPDQDKPQQRQIIRRAMCTAAMKIAAAPQMMVSWEEQVTWGLRWSEERYQQGDDEKLIGLKISPLNDRNLHHQFPKFVMDYLTVMWMPLWQELCRFDTSHNFYNQTSPGLEASLARWAELHRSSKTIDIPDDLKKLTIGASLMPIYISARLWRAREYAAVFAESIRLNLVE